MNRRGQAYPLSIAATNGAARLRVVLLGMRCAYSVPPLTALIEAGFDVRAVVLPAPVSPPSSPVILTSPSVILSPQAKDPPPSAGPSLRRHRRRGRDGRLKPGDPSPPPQDDSRRGPVDGGGGDDAGGVGDADIARIAQAAGILLIGMGGGRDADALTRIAALRPDVIVVACFPWRLPTALLASPPLGCLNVHPSLLPRGRGPEPVFWTLRRGERQTGVTIHRMDAGFDTGPIAAQQAIAVPEGVRAPDLELRLARLGARLLVETLPCLAAGDLALTPQDDALATAAPPPTAADWVVPTNLPAGWAYSFARGVAPLGGPLELLALATGDRFPLADALDYDPARRLDRPFRIEGDTLVARFVPGTARFRVRGVMGRV